MSELQKLAYSIADAVKVTGVGRSRLYELIKSGDIPTRKCGARTLIRHQDLQAFIDALPNPSTGEKRHD